MHFIRSMALMAALLLAESARSEVQVYFENSNGVGSIEYACTDGELIRAFALDVSVDAGNIIGITNFFRGPCTITAQGYGIFPASLRGQITPNATNVDWNAAGYNPVANPADAPADTLPGLASNGVTLEFGALWDPLVPGAAPGTNGTLCCLILSQPANVSLKANKTRGGVVSAFAANQIQAVFIGGFSGPSIARVTLSNGKLNILFSGGELQTAPSPNGPWTGTGDQSGNHTEEVGTNQAEFYRVHNPQGP